MKRLFTALLCLAVMLSFAACGSTAKPAETGDNTVTDADAVSVGTVTEFLDAIAPGATIKLAAGTYNLTEAKGFGGKNVSDYYRWENLGDGSQAALVIEDVEGLTIGGDEGAEIVTECSWANVLRFNHCDGLTVKNLHVGHTEQTEACEGGVISLINCDDVSIENCDLYGCGTMGVDANQCWNLQVTGCSVHHCSYGGISLYSGKHVFIGDCSVYDCGQGPDTAWSCFNLSDTTDVTISGCSVKDSNFSNLLCGYFPDGVVTVENLAVTGNQFDSLFAFDGKLVVNGLNLADNMINKWQDTWNIPEIILDGKPCSDADLDKAYGEQLSTNGIGQASEEPVAINTDGAKTVHVSTADEFIKAIASDTLIIIDSEQIDLSTAKNYGEGAIEFWNCPEDSFFGDKNWVWEQVYDGHALWIGNVSNLHIQGGKLVTAPRYANVLGFYNCSNISLNGTTLGHLEGSECAGGVVYLYGCSDAVLESCELYGCGIYGVQTELSDNLHLQNNYIHDCSYGAAVFSSSNDVTCLNTAVISCPSPVITVEGCENFIWEDKIMAPQCSFDPAFG